MLSSLVILNVAFLLLVAANYYHRRRRKAAPELALTYEPVPVPFRWLADPKDEFWRNEKVVRVEEALVVNMQYQEAVALCNAGKTAGLSLDPAFAASIIKYYDFQEPVCAASGAERVYIDYTTGVVITYETDGRISIKKYE